VGFLKGPGLRGLHGDEGASVQLPDGALPRLRSPLLRELGQQLRGAESVQSRRLRGTGIVCQLNKHPFGCAAQGSLPGVGQSERDDVVERLQWYLAHKKQRFPRTLQKEYT